MNYLNWVTEKLIRGDNKEKRKKKVGRATFQVLINQPRNKL